jgi:hypothetical protein
MLLLVAAVAAVAAVVAAFSYVSNLVCTDSTFSLSDMTSEVRTLPMFLIVR